MAKAKSSEQAWRALEEEHLEPRAVDLKALSGLLEEDIERFARSWPLLPPQARLSLVRSLVEVAEDDFEMDFSAVFRLVMRDEDAEIRALAIEGLHEDEDVRLVPRFAKCLQEDSAPTVRAAAARALGQFVLLGELGKIRPRPFEEAFGVLQACYRNSAEVLEVRRRSLESLAFSSLEVVSEAIAEAYLHPDESMRVSAVFAMGRSADKRWADTVRGELHALAPEMRYEATRACGELQLREAAPELVDMVKDGDAEVQEMALWALGQVGGDLAMRTLRRYARSKDEALQSAAQAALDEVEFFQGDLSTFFSPDIEQSHDTAWDTSTEADEDDFDEEDSDDAWDDEDDGDDEDSAEDDEDGAEDPWD